MIIDPIKKRDTITLPSGDEVIIERGDFAPHPSNDFVRLRLQGAGGMAPLYRPDELRQLLPWIEKFLDS